MWKVYVLELVVVIVVALGWGYLITKQLEQETKEKTK